MARAVQRPAARRDFIIHYVYIAENAGVEVAKRFRQAVESAYARHPARGSCTSQSGSPGSTLAPAFPGQDLREALWLPRFPVRISGKHLAPALPRARAPASATGTHLRVSSLVDASSGADAPTAVPLDR